ncbi:MAG TPA: hypothetical protein H9795_00730 [Candidatus Fournierella merdigallinarum]|nr:hypothetical protein [Candidatus Fournierella merdigallinarum]
MRILCSNCGLRYDPAQSEGICPYCGRYNEPAEADAAAQQDLPEPPEEEIVWAPPPPPRRRVSRVALVLLGVLVLVFAIEMAAFPAAVRVSRASQALEAYVPEATLTQAAQNEPFAFGPGGRQVTVGTAEFLDDMRGASENGRMVRVWCGAKKMEDYQSAWEVDVFLQAGEVWYPAVSSYELEGFYPELATGMLDPYELQSIAMAEGWIYFAVPAGAEELVFWLQSQTRDRDYELEQVEMIGVPLAMQEGSVKTQ